ncbi:MAG: hypothetical protein AB7S38_32315 [Vulcanimicrobiota bacterium]
MRCPHCQSLIEKAARCPDCGQALTVRHQRGDYHDFKATLVPFAIPPDVQPGSYQIRLEVENLQNHRVGFWETDFEIVQKP